jgi:hypothetical protein
MIYCIAGGYEMAKQANEIVAFHLGWDMAEVSDCRYQRHTAPAVYAIGDHYFTAPTAKQKLPVDWEWERVGEYYGRPVYRSL